MLFSKNTGWFYDPRICIDSLPDDVVEVSDEVHQALLQAQSEGKLIAASESGAPIAIDPPQASVLDLLDQAKNEMRALREPMLSAVTGIGWDASVSGDTELAKEAQVIRNALRDITDDPALNAAQTYEEMRAAGVAAYRRIAAGASHAFAATFKEFTGA